MISGEPHSPSLGTPPSATSWGRSESTLAGVGRLPCVRLRKERNTFRFWKAPHPLPGGRGALVEWTEGVSGATS